MSSLTDLFSDPFSFFSGGGDNGSDLGVGLGGSLEATDMGGGTGISGNGIASNIDTVGAGAAKAIGGALLKTAANNGGANGGAGGFMAKPPDYHRFQPTLGTSAAKEPYQSKAAPVADAQSIQNMWISRMRSFSTIYDRTASGERTPNV